MIPSKTKTFLFSLLFTPVLIVGIGFFTSRISQVEGGRPPVKVVVTDLSAQLASQIEAAMSKHNQSNPKRQIIFESLPAQDDTNAVEEQGREQLRSGKAEAYIVIDQNIIDGAGKTHVYTYKSKPTMMDATWAVEEFIRNAVVAQRCKVQNVSQKLLDDIRNVSIEQVEIGETANEQHVQSQGQTTVKMMVPFFFMFMIYMGIIGIGQQMLSSVIEEKNSRIIEMLLSAVSPFELMAGKILGLGGDRPDNYRLVDGGVLRPDSVAGYKRGYNRQAAVLLCGLLYSRVPFFQRAAGGDWLGLQYAKGNAGVYEARRFNPDISDDSVVQACSKSRRRFCQGVVAGSAHIAFGDAFADFSRFKRQQF